MTSVRDLFDTWALAGRAEGMERGHGHAARLAVGRLGLNERSRYLDIGCGNGYTVRWAARAATLGRAVGVDLSPEMILLARRLSRDLPNASFVAGEFPGVDLGGDASFDAIFSMEAFYYFADPGAALSRVRDLLAPGGLFACVIDYYGENRASHGWQEQMGVPMTLLDAAGWARAFAGAGLIVVEQTRLRLPAGGARDADDAWQETEGSLLTLGARGTPSAPPRAAG
jgi:SAM-dependent methyltransferase